MTDIADEFVDKLITTASRIANIRGAETLEIKDVEQGLEHQDNMRHSQERVKSRVVEFETDVVTAGPEELQQGSEEKDIGALGVGIEPFAYQFGMLT